MKLWVGTSGYSYKQWKGSFYPEDLAEKNMLRFYGEHFSTGEINTTFSCILSPPVLAPWSEGVPKEFRFVHRPPRRIPPEKRLADVGDDVSFLSPPPWVLVTKLGPIFFHPPPFS